MEHPLTSDRVKHSDCAEHQAGVGRDIRLLVNVEWGLSWFLSGCSTGFVADNKRTLGR